VVSGNPARTREPGGEGSGSTLVLLPTAERASNDLAADLIAVLFAAAGPLTVDAVARALGVAAEQVTELAAQVTAAPPLGLALQRFDDRLQLGTTPSSAAAVERLLGAPPPVRLSRAALEALAVIAYRQPVTRGEIDAVRGVNSDSAVSTLLTRNLVAEVGRRDTVGRPMLLAVTPDCLQYLGISSLEELPPLPEGASRTPDD
jgi:segregation and condensation protein B